MSLMLVLGNGHLVSLADGKIKSMVSADSYLFQPMNTFASPELVHMVPGLLSTEHLLF